MKHISQEELVSLIDKYEQEHFKKPSLIQISIKDYEKLKSMFGITRPVSSLTIRDIPLVGAEEISNGEYIFVP
jgi:hypothetical protein